MRKRTMVRLISGVFLAGVVAAGSARADMGDDCYQTEDWNLKLAGCTRVIESGQWKESDLAWAYSNRGLAYQFLGDDAAALREIDKALELEPLSHRTLNIRGSLRARTGNMQGAERDWKKSFELGGSGFVQAHQDWMRSLGHYTGPSDGVYGPRMREAMHACAQDLAC